MYVNRRRQLHTTNLVNNYYIDVVSCTPRCFLQDRQPNALECGYINTEAIYPNARIKVLVS